MKTEYGSKVAGALKAVAQMHSDTSKLLVDCDKQIGRGRRSVFGSYATKELTYNFQAEYWMAEGVYRYYEAGPMLVDGVTVAFFHGQAIEPLLLVAQIRYSYKPGDPEPPVLRDRCDEWDAWSLYFSWGESRELGKVHAYGGSDAGRIEWARLVAVPLFSIRRIEDVVEMMDRVRAASPDGAEAAASGA